MARLTLAVPVSSFVTWSRRCHHESLVVGHWDLATLIGFDILVDPFTLSCDQGSRFRFFWEGPLVFRCRKPRMEGAGNREPFWIKSKGQFIVLRILLLNWRFNMDYLNMGEYAQLLNSTLVIPQEIDVWASTCQEQGM